MVPKQRSLLSKIEHPNRKTIRTVFQAFVMLCAAAPALVAWTGLTAQQAPWMFAALPVAAAVTRAMNTPRVEAVLSRFLPWLAAKSPPLDTDVTE